MCIEEPSIVAAACNGAKIIASNGGFTAKSNDPIMMGQIQIYDVSLEHAKLKLERAKENLIRNINVQYCSNMTARGGGVTTFLAPKRANR